MLLHCSEAVLDRKSEASGWRNWECYICFVRASKSCCVPSPKHFILAFNQCEGSCSLSQRGNWTSML